MKSVLELAVEVVSSHASNTALTTDQLISELQAVHAVLLKLDTGMVTPENTLETADEQKDSSLTVRQAFKKNEVICLECSKGGFKTLKKHLATAHQLTPTQYRKKHNIKSSQKLAAKSFSDARRKAAEERGMSDVLAKAREKRMANFNAKSAAAPAAKTVKAAPKAATRGRKKAPAPA